MIDTDITSNSRERRFAGKVKKGDIANMSRHCGGDICFTVVFAVHLIHSGIAETRHIALPLITNNMLQGKNEKAVLKLGVMKSNNLLNGAATTHSHSYIYTLPLENQKKVFSTYMVGWLWTVE